MVKGVNPIFLHHALWSKRVSELMGREETEILDTSDGSHSPYGAIMTVMRDPPHPPPLLAPTSRHASGLWPHLCTGVDDLFPHRFKTGNNGLAKIIYAHCLIIHPPPQCLYPELESAQQRWWWPLRGARCHALLPSSPSPPRRGKEAATMGNSCQSSTRKECLLHNSAVASVLQEA